MLEKLEKGWCKGVIGDHVGIFPESYVESAESDVQRQAPAIAVARAIHDFAGGQNALWLTFAKGDLIEVLSMETGKGWWHGRLQNGKSGVFPANYVKIEVCFRMFLKSLIVLLKFLFLFHLSGEFER